MKIRHLILLAEALTGSEPAEAATFTVTTTNDSGGFTLRQAILDANASPGADVITFNIAAGGLSISPGSALPAITEAVTIDGATQPGFAGAPIIELNGASAGAGADGLRVTAGNCTVRGLVINRFNGDGIELATGGTNVVENCYVGLNLAGTLDQGNILSGVFITNSAANVIGGATTAARNYIAGNNQHGVHLGGLAASNNVVLGNVIGLGVNDSDQGNSLDGVRLNAPRNRIGGAAAGGRNVISGNNSEGIELTGTNATGNVILGNYIGTDSTGGLTRPNSAGGILVSGAPGNNIGGGGAGEGNLISGNFGDGIEINGVAAAFNQVLGNRIGSDSTGALPLGNSANGIEFTFNARSNVVGGVAGGAGNFIAFNTGGDGVFVNTGTNNAIRGNAIHSNGNLGIDLGASGVTANDAGDVDGGANQLQNFPILTGAAYNGVSVTIQGALNSRASTTYALDVFASGECDASGNGEGQVYLGSTNLLTDGVGNAGFTVTLAAALTGRIVTATATDPHGNTSEFSPCVAASSSVAGLTFTVVNTNDVGAGSLRQAILDANAAITVGDIIAFNIPGVGPHTIFPGSALPALIDPGTTIDGYTQPGASPNTLTTSNDAVIKIRLHGGSAGFGTNGLRLASSNHLVRGLCLIRFNSDAIGVANNGLNGIEGNFIGIDVDGVTSQANTGNGVFLNRAFNNRVGGTTPAARNLISGNSSAGVAVQGPGASGNQIQGNLIGVSATVMLRRGNANAVTIFDADNNIVGGATPGAANILAGGSSGVSFSGSASNNVVQGNFIGTDFTGALNLGNTVAGIAFTGGRGNTIGGTADGEGNLIAFNGVGVNLISFSNATNDAIRGNVIFSNTGLGIDLGTAGVTTNDLNDADTGPNFQQNFPVLTAATNRASETIVHATLNSRPGITYALDFFANLVCDGSGNGEGQQFLGSLNVVTDGGGNASFNVSLPVMAQGRFITATATDALGNTSEFAACREAVSEIGAGLFVVTNTNDSGAGSLRQAMLDVNNSPAASNVITFNIAGPGPHTIAPLTALPVPTQPVTIDGFTQPGASANTLPNGNNAVWLVRLDGGSVGGTTDGLKLTIGGLIVRGLIVTRFGGDGIEVSSGTGSRVEGNCIVSNSQNGVFITAAAGHTVGGVTPATRNVIAANNSSGVQIGGASASNNIVQGNFIGTDATGALDRGNTASGVTVSSAPRNSIGGAAAGAGNLISGNNLHGVNISSFAATGNLVQGNRIGTDVTGTLALGNTVDGVNVGSASGNLIGGTAPGAGNLVSGNGATGITITGSGANSNVVQVNLVGTDATGANPLPNGSHGVVVATGASHNRIGGSGNVIAFNNGDGVAVLLGTNNAIRHNSIFENTGLGIDLANEFANNGVTTNDLNDADSGPNFLQNFPLLTAATANPGTTVISGTLNSRPNTTYALDFFSNAECDSSGHGEGQIYLGSTNATTDGSGNTSFTVTLPVVLQGRQVTATATDPSGNTSEFSPCASAASTIPPQDFTVTNTNDDGPGSLRRVLLAQNQAVSASNNTVSFNIPGPGPHVIRPLTPLPPGLEAATMNGFTQPGSSPNTSTNGSNNAVIQIVIEGAAPSGGAAGAGLGPATAGAGPVDGFVVRGDGSIIKGVTLNRHTGNGLRILANNVVVAGFRAQLNGQDGIVIQRGTGNHIGGSAPADRCSLSQNGGHGLSFLSTATSGNIAENVECPFNQLNGVRIASSSGNLVTGCSMGLNRMNGVEISGTSATGNMIEKSLVGPNSENGVRIDRSPGNRVGPENSIEDNQRNGVDLEGATASGNVVGGNLILRNGLNGVGLSQAPSNTVGGAGTGNIIGLNDNDGVNISGSAAIRNVVANNSIGQSFIERLGNERAGVTVTANASDNTVGPNNTISFNKGDGVLIQLGAVRNRITVNSISANDQLGIDLDANEVTPNDGPGDPDAGANLRQNFPILNNACWDGSNLLIFGTLISAPNTLFQVEFFLNSICDPSLHGEGERFIGVAGVMTDNTGRADFSITLAASGVASDSIITCTATDPAGNTSEFSPCFSPIVSKAPIIFLTVTNLNDDGPGSFRDALRRSNAHFASNRNVIIFVLSGPGPFRISPLSALPPITQPVDIDGCNNTNGGGGFQAAGGQVTIDCKVVVSGRNAGLGVYGLEIAPEGSGSIIRNITFTEFSGNGIQIGSATDGPANGNVIQGTCLVTNLGHGLSVHGSNNTIGGTNENEFNQIFGNGGAGAAVFSGIGNAFYSLCGDNGGPGFDLLGDGPTPNDAGDADTGPNNLQNFPVLSTAFSTSTSTTVKGTFQGKSNTVYTLTFTTSAQADPSGHGEGEKHLGIEVVRTDANGLANINVTFGKPTPVGHFVSATATCPDNGTSEFGRNGPTGPGDAADLGVTIMGNTNRVRAGDLVICTNTIYNFGPANATGVQGMFTPPCVEIVSFVPSQGSCVVTNEQVVCDLGTILADAMATLIVTTRPTNTTTITNTFTATATQPDTNPDNNTMVKTVDVLPALPGQADLAVGIAGPSQLLVGQDITSTVSVTNNSANTANGVALKVILPPGAQFNFTDCPTGSVRMSTGTEKLVNQVFMDLTGRPANPTELSSFTAAIVGGSLTPFQLAQSLIHSTEYRRMLTMELYDRFLDRPPISQELSMALASFAAGANTEDFIVQLLGSDEFFDNTFGTVEDFIDELFDELLPDDVPTQRQLDDLDDILMDVNDRTQRERAVRYVLGLLDFCDQIAEELSLRYGRGSSALADELFDLWDNGLPIETLIAHVMASDAYSDIAACFVICDLGTVPGGGSVQIQVSYAPSLPGDQPLTAMVSSSNDAQRTNDMTQVMTPADLPALSIARENGNVTISWPDVRGFGLRSTTNFIDWEDVPGVPLASTDPDDPPFIYHSEPIGQGDSAKHFQLDGKKPICIEDDQGTILIKINLRTGDYEIHKQGAQNNPVEKGKADAQLKKGTKHTYNITAPKGASGAAITLRGTIDLETEDGSAVLRAAVYGSIDLRDSNIRDNDCNFGPNPP